MFILIRSFGLLLLCWLPALQAADSSMLILGEPLPLNTGSVALWQMMLVALAGGVILNLTPCVLPVLGSKLGSIITLKQHDSRSLRLQFLASSAGIVASFMALALLMAGLRLSNHTLGWGIQFRNPWFIGLLVAITLLFSASLFDLFHLRLPALLNTQLATGPGNRLGEHFWQGAFATLLATPCLAPFFETAVAFALVASLSLLWLMFLALGVGMSLPWLLIAVWPALALKLPRPGRRVNGLRIVPGLLMLAFCFWLLSLLVNHIGRSTTLFIAGLMVVALLLTLLQRAGPRMAVIVSGYGLLSATTLWLMFMLTTHFDHQPRHDTIRQLLLSEQTLATYKRVFIDAVPGGGMTCKANKFNILMCDDVQQALQTDDVIVLPGNGSHSDPAISIFLPRFDSVVVPFNHIDRPASSHRGALYPLLDSKDFLKTLKNTKGTEK